MLFDDFLINYALWLWVPHRASLVRDDGGGFGSNSRLNSRVLVRWQRSNAVHPSSLRAQRSNPSHIRNEAGLLRCARNDGCGEGRKIHLSAISFERCCSMTSAQTTRWLWVPHRVACAGRQLAGLVQTAD